MVISDDRLMELNRILAVAACLDHKLLDEFVDEVKTSLDALTVDDLAKLIENRKKKENAK